MRKNIDTFLKSIGEKKVFSRNEIESFVGYDVSKTLSTMIKSGKIEKLGGGYYFLKGYSENLESPYFFVPYVIEGKNKVVGYGGALEYYGINEQFFNSVVIITDSKFSQKRKIFAGYSYILSKGTDFGFGIDVKALPYGNFRITDMERTVLDCFSRPDLCGGLKQIAKAFYEADDESVLDYRKLETYLERYPNKRKLYKTLGFFIDTFNMAVPKDFYEKAYEIANGSNYVHLESSVSKFAKLKYDPKWKLTIDSDENFKSLIMY